ncbi:Chitinase 2 [Podospora pseudopauciseta]|uniref:chitinase n=1 Tax=Podospora pseudopauciseta TaxID=2093780 RepID=A0ABR0I2F5_9PEZI|nr:Chitinase 2 [Podospora pseudopauciseta]
MFTKTLVVAALAAAPAFAAPEVNVYWGQTAGSRLSTFCDASGFDYVTVGFLNKSPSQDPSGANWPGTNFGSHCDGVYYKYNGANTNVQSDCGKIAADIRYCQKKGKKVLLSIGGEWKTTANYDLSNEAEGRRFALFVWQAFGPRIAGSIVPRPFDDYYLNAEEGEENFVFDGFDFDIEKSYDANQSKGYIAMISSLRQFMATPQLNPNNRQFLITAAPECPLNDPYYKMKHIIKNSKFDLLFVQFYNNPGCHGVTNNNFDAWASHLQSTASSGAKIFIGLPGSTNAVQNGEASGYLTPTNLRTVINKFKGRAAFGGVMIYDATYGARNIVSGSSPAGLNYYQYARSLLGGYTHTVTPPAPTPTACVREYSVKSGDYCYQIAARAGIDLSDLNAFNPGLNCNILGLGQKLCIKRGIPKPTSSSSTILSTTSSTTVSSTTVSTTISSTETSSTTVSSTETSATSTETSATSTESSTISTESATESATASETVTETETITANEPDITTTTVETSAEPTGITYTEDFTSTETESVTVTDIIPTTTSTISTESSTAESATESVTESATESVTESATVTETETITTSPTLTESATATETASETESYCEDDETTTSETATATETASGTETVTATESATESATASEAETITASATLTASETEVTTVSETATETESYCEDEETTETATATASETESAVVSVTETATASETEAVTETATASETESVTETATASETEAVTETATASETEAVTETVTASETESAIETVTASETGSVIASETESSIESATASETGSVIASETETLPASETTTDGPVITPSESFTTSTIYSTTTFTVTSCEPSVTSCPGRVVTKTIAIGTTICPVTTTDAPVITSSSSLPAGYTTSTIYSTKTLTLTSCAPTVTNCPAGSTTTVVVPIGTTVCPISEAEATSTPVPAVPGVETSSKPAIKVITDVPAEEETTTSTTTFVQQLTTIITVPKPDVTATSKPAGGDEGVVVKPTPSGGFPYSSGYVKPIASATQQPVTAGAGRNGVVLGGVIAAALVLAF